jgi:hypothetical protein
MIPHPNRLVASAEEHRQDLLALAARERLSATVSDQTPRASLLPPLWGLVTHVIRMMCSGLSVNAQPRPRVWTLG